MFAISLPPWWLNVVIVEITLLEFMLLMVLLRSMWKTSPTCIVINGMLCGFQSFKNSERSMWYEVLVTKESHPKWCWLWMWGFFLPMRRAKYLFRVLRSQYWDIEIEVFQLWTWEKRGKCYAISLAIADNCLSQWSMLGSGVTIM
jgi:hypothetical protein